MFSGVIFVSNTILHFCSMNPENQFCFAYRYQICNIIVPVFS